VSVQEFQYARGTGASLTMVSHKAMYTVALSAYHAPVEKLFPGMMWFVKDMGRGPNISQAHICLN